MVRPLLPWIRLDPETIDIGNRKAQILWQHWPFDISRWHFTNFVYFLVCSLLWTIFIVIFSNKYQVEFTQVSLSCCMLMWNIIGAFNPQVPWFRVWKKEKNRTLPSLILSTHFQGYMLYYLDMTSRFFQIAPYLTRYMPWSPQNPR